MGALFDHVDELDPTTAIHIEIDGIPLDVIGATGLGQIADVALDHCDLELACAMAPRRSTTS